MISQRCFLQELCNKYGDFKVARAWRDSEGTPHWTTHRSVLDCWHSDDGLRFLDTVNNRTILPCEIVLDLDTTPSLLLFHQLCDFLEKEYGFAYLAYTSGSRGFHVHIIDGALLDCTTRLRQEMRKILIQKTGCDLLKQSEKVMIALENAPHWKTGQPKTLLRRYPL